SEIISSFLFAQFENIDLIQEKRKKLWNLYRENLEELRADGRIMLPHIPDFATNNAHMFYIVCNSLEERTQLINYLKEEGIMSVFHYLSLHKSEYYHQYYDGKDLPNSDHYTDSLLRLPLF